MNKILSSTIILFHNFPITIRMLLSVIQTNILIYLIEQMTNPLTVLKDMRGGNVKASVLKCIHKILFINNKSSFRPYNRVKTALFFRFPSCDLFFYFSCKQSTNRCAPFTPTQVDNVIIFFDVSATTPVSYCDSSFIFATKSVYSASSSKSIV